MNASSQAATRSAIVGASCEASHLLSLRKLFSSTSSVCRNATSALRARSSALADTASCLLTSSSATPEEGTGVEGSAGAGGVEEDEDDEEDAATGEEKEVERDKGTGAGPN